MQDKSPLSLAQSEVVTEVITSLLQICPAITDFPRFTLHKEKPCFSMLRQVES